MTPIANVSMLIRAPAHDVFNAFLDPATLTRFWLSSASAPLANGKSVTWEFRAPRAIAQTRVRELVQDRRLVLEWVDEEIAELTFEKRADGHTRLEIQSPVTARTAEDALARVVEATQGYTLVVSNLKVLLETGQSAGLVEDKAVLIAEKQSASGG